RFGHTHTSGVDDEGEKRQVAKVAAENVDVAATVRDDAQTKATRFQFAEHRSVRRGRGPYGSGETGDDLLVQSSIKRQAEEFELPGDVPGEHVVQADRPDSFIGCRQPLCMIERATDGGGCDGSLGSCVKVLKARQPILTVAVERTAQVEEDRAEHAAVASVSQ